MDAAIPSPPTQLQPEQPIAHQRADRWIWGIFIGLCVVSIIELYSASSREVGSTLWGVIMPVIRHSALLAFGALIVWGLSRMNYTKLIPGIWIFTCVSVILMVAVMIGGDVINGARRSITIPIIGISLFPAEMIKLSAVLMIAYIMTRNQNPNSVGITRKGAIIAAIVVMFMSALLLEQGLTNTLLLIAISYSMMIVAGVKIKHILAASVVFLVAGLVFLLIFSAGNRSDTWSVRVQRWMDKEQEAPKYEQPIDAKNQQEIFSYMAQANGGMTGVMPGNSREASRLPLAFSDYIFAIIIEECGLIGGVLLLGAYLTLLGRAAGIASKCSRTLPALLVIGMAIWISFQALFHMAIVTGVFPVSGQPLPLISKGGTSILVTAVAFGIMLSVSRTAARTNDKKEIKKEIEALPEEMREANPMKWVKDKK